ncbi:MAG: VWA domain-containing protein [Pseudomonadota bacterium]
MVTELIFLRPIWFLALLIIAALAVLWFRRAGRPGDWQTQIQPELMAAMTRLGRMERGSRSVVSVLPFAIVGLVCLALTGPAIGTKSANTFRNLDGVVFVMDVSGSMTRDPVWPAIITMARGGLSELGSKPAALVVYAGDSYIASPLTTDHEQLGQTIALLDEKTVPDKGNRPALALADAADLLEQAQILAGDVIWLTDGAGAGPQVKKTVDRIESLGARLSVVAAQTSVGGTEPLDHEAFEALAGDGQVYATDDIRAFMNDVGRADATRLERQDLQLLLLEDMGRYLLFLALLPLLVMFRREAV